MAEMGNIGNKAKAAGKFEVPYVDVIIDVGVGIYDNCQSGASAREFISDAVVDVVLTTGETVATSAITAGATTITTIAIAGLTGGSVVPGVGNVIGFGSRNTCRNCSSEFRQFRFRWKWKIIKG